jgi:hypothetical protein
LLLVNVKIEHPAHVHVAQSTKYSDLSLEVLEQLRLHGRLRAF